MFRHLIFGVHISDHGGLVLPLGNLVEVCQVFRAQFREIFQRNQPEALDGRSQVAELLCLRVRR